MRTIIVACCLVLASTAWGDTRAAKTVPVVVVDHQQALIVKVDKQTVEITWDKPRAHTFDVKPGKVRVAISTPGEGGFGGPRELYVKVLSIAGPTVIVVENDSSVKVKSVSRAELERIVKDENRPAPKTKAKRIDPKKQLIISNDGSCQKKADIWFTLTFANNVVVNSQGAADSFDLTKHKLPARIVAQVGMDGPVFASFVARRAGEVMLSNECKFWQQ